MPDNPATLRTFIALPLPAEWTEALATTIADLRRTIPAGVRWVNSSGIHLTLKFLGATDAAIAPRIVSELSGSIGRRRVADAFVVRPGQISEPGQSACNLGRRIR